MENQPLNSNPQPVGRRSIRWRQVLAAVLLCSPFFLSLVGSLIIFEYQTAQDFYRMQMLGQLVVLAGLLLLVGIAANRMSRVAVCLLTIMPLVMSAFYALLWQGVLPEASNACFYFRHYSGLIGCLLNIYAFSLILRGNEIKESRRSWITLFPVFEMFAILVFFSNIAYNQAPDTIEVWPDLVFSTGKAYTWFSYILRILLLVAWFKLTHSEAFASVYDSSPVPSGAYLPLTRYEVMVLVCSALFLALMCPLYRYAELFV